jgi:hypothetical protein
MDLGDLHFGSALRGRLSERVHGLSKGARAFARLRVTPLAASRGFRIGLGLLLLSGGLGVGKWAKDLSGEEFLRGWLGEHAPPQAVWDRLLPAFGLKRADDPELIHRALRSMTPGTDQPGSIWSGNDGSWVAVFPAETDAMMPRVYCEDCKTKEVIHWNDLGRGWPALSELEVRLQKRQDEAKLRRVTRTEDPVDPREIRY